MDNDLEFECEMEHNGKANQAFRIAFDNTQARAFKDMLDEGGIIPGVSTLDIGSNAGVSGWDLVLGPSFNLEEKVKKNQKDKEDRGRGPNRALSATQGRRLSVTGNKPILAVKVFDVYGVARAESVATISDDIFGSGSAANNRYSSSTDPVNLASQLYECSMETLEVIPGDMGNAPSPVPYEAPGVITVDIAIDIKSSTDAGSRYNVRNAVTTAVQTKLGFSLPGPYQQVMYVLENCYHDCGWAAYAYINSWNSVYQGSYYKQTGVLVHELGKPSHLLATYLVINEF